MSHVRKMVLVPQGLVERLQQQSSPSTNPDVKSVQTPGTTASRLDAEMCNILNSTNRENDQDRWSRYNQILQRYLHLKDDNHCDKNAAAQGDQIAIVQQEDEGSSNAEIKRQEADMHIVESVPVKFRNNAARLLRRLRVTGIMDWDENGVLSIDGKGIHGANMIDLINDAMRPRKIQPPTGHRQFADALRRAGMPREYIGNARVWSEITTDTQYPSKDSARPSQSESDSQDSSSDCEAALPSRQTTSGKTYGGGGETQTSPEKKRKLPVKPAVEVVKKWRRMSGSFKS